MGFMVRARGVIRSSPLRPNRPMLLRGLATSMRPARPNPSFQIQLTKTEEELCTLLHQCAEHLRTTQPALEPVQCRIAGGWVRDKVSQWECGAPARSASDVSSIG